MINIIQDVLESQIIVNIHGVDVSATTNWIWGWMRNLMGRRRTPHNWQRHTKFNSTITNLEHSHDKKGKSPIVSLVTEPAYSHSPDSSPFELSTDFPNLVENNSSRDTLPSHTLTLAFPNILLAPYDQNPTDEEQGSGSTMSVRRKWVKVGSGFHLVVFRVFKIRSSVSFLRSRPLARPFTRLTGINLGIWLQEKDKDKKKHLF